MLATLLHQAQITQAAAGALSANLRAPRVAVCIGLRSWSSRSFVTSALVELGWGTIGSQGHAGSEVMLMSANDAALAALATANKRFLGRLVAVTSVGLCRPVIRLPADPRAYADGRFEAVLHPRLDAAPETALARFGAFIESLGGTSDAHRAWVVDDLIFVPATLPPAQATAAVAYQPLRVLRPMARIGLRSASLED